MANLAKSVNNDMLMALRKALALWRENHLKSFGGHGHENTIFEERDFYMRELPALFENWDLELEDEAE